LVTGRPLVGDLPVWLSLLGLLLVERGAKFSTIVI